MFRCDSVSELSTRSWTSITTCPSARILLFWSIWWRSRIAEIENTTQRCLVVLLRLLRTRR